MLHLRPILPSDDATLEEVIRTSMLEMNAPKEGTILGDPSRATMSQNYPGDNEIYYVAEWNGKVVGGAGIGRLAGTDGKVCELQRMFLNTSAHGKGIGKSLMEQCLKKAAEFGYSHCYIETLPIMEAAQGLYRKYGFKYIDGPMGSTGHGGCSVFMVREIN